MNFVNVFPWNEQFETGLPEIDKQHRQLVDLLNALASHFAFQSDPSTLNVVFIELIDYAALHFETEDAIWGTYLPGYESTVKHRKDHNSFLEKVAKLKAEEKTKPLEVVIENILSFITHWLAFHILENDIRMAKLVLALQSGMPLSLAKDHADKQMSRAMNNLTNTILTLYDPPSGRSRLLKHAVTERKKAAQKQRLSATAVEQTLDAICITNANGVIVDANPSFLEAVELKHPQVIGKSLTDIKAGFDDENITGAIWQKARENGYWSGEVFCHTKQGNIERELLTLSSVKDQSGQIQQYVAAFSNSENLIKRQQKLEILTHHHALIGLPNRLLIEDCLKQAMAHGEWTDKLVAVCIIKLEGFKPTNDLIDHAVGDYVLNEIGLRLQNVTRDQDTAARLDGDKLIIVLGGLGLADHAVITLDRIMGEITAPIIFGNREINVMATVGISFFPEDGKELDTLVQQAEKSMNQARQKGKSRYCLSGKMD